MGTPTSSGEICPGPGWMRQDWVIQMWVMAPGPSRSARTRSSPGMMIQLSRLRPVWSQLEARAVRAVESLVRLESRPVRGDVAMVDVPFKRVRGLALDG